MVGDCCVLGSISLSLIFRFSEINYPPLCCHYYRLRYWFLVFFQQFLFFFCRLCILVGKKITTRIWFFFFCNFSAFVNIDSSQQSLIVDCHLSQWVAIPRENYLIRTKKNMEFFLHFRFFFFFFLLGDGLKFLPCSHPVFFNWLFSRKVKDIEKFDAAFDIFKYCWAINFKSYGQFKKKKVLKNV